MQILFTKEYPEEHLKQVLFSWQFMQFDVQLFEARFTNEGLINILINI